MEFAADTAARDPRVLAVLGRHAKALTAAKEFVITHAPADLLQAPYLLPARKLPKDGLLRLRGPVMDVLILARARLVHRSAGDPCGPLRVSDATGHYCAWAAYPALH